MDEDEERKKDEKDPARVRQRREQAALENARRLQETKAFQVGMRVRVVQPASEVDDSIEDDDGSGGMKKAEPETWAALGRYGQVVGLVEQQPGHYFFQISLEPPDADENPRPVSRKKRKKSEPNEETEPVVETGDRSAQPEGFSSGTETLVQQSNSDKIISVSARYLKIVVVTVAKNRLQWLWRKHWPVAKAYLLSIWPKIKAHHNEFAMLLGGACLTPICLQLYTPLHCTYTETAPRVWSVTLHADDTSDCFTGLHLFWVFFSLLGLSIFLPSVCLFMPILSSRPSYGADINTQTIAYKPHFIAARTLLRASLPGTQTFLLGRMGGNLAQFIFSVAAVVSLFCMVSTIQPCSQPTVNYIHMSTYACVLWSSMIVMTFGLIPEDIVAPEVDIGEGYQLPDDLLLEQQHREAAEITATAADETLARPGDLPDDVVAACLILLGWALIAMFWCIPNDCFAACAVWKTNLSRTIADLRYALGGSGSSKVNIYRDPTDDDVDDATDKLGGGNGRQNKWMAKLGKPNESGDVSEEHPSLGSSVTHLAADAKKYPAGTRVLLFGNSNDKKFMMGPEKKVAQRIGDEAKVIKWDGLKGRLLLAMEPTVSHPVKCAHCNQRYTSRGDMSAQPITINQAMGKVREALQAASRMPYPIKTMGTPAPSAAPTAEGRKGKLGAVDGTLSVIESGVVSRSTKEDLQKVEGTEAAITGKAKGTVPASALVEQACKVLPGLRGRYGALRRLPFRQQLKAVCDECGIQTNWGDSTTSSVYKPQKKGPQPASSPSLPQCTRCQDTGVQSTLAPQTLWVLPENITEAFPWSHVPLDELVDDLTCPAAVDVERKEVYLSPPDLQRAFMLEGVKDLSSFYALPKYKQKRAKIRNGLGAP